MSTEVSRELQEYHLERLESLMEQWAFDEEMDIDPVVALTEISQSGRGAERLATLQGGLGEMRESLAAILKKPSVILPTMGIALAGIYHLADSQMTLADLEYMRDTNAIAQAEFEQRFEAAKQVVGRGKEITLGLLGIGGATAAALNFDRIKAILSGKGQQVARETAGASPQEHRLGSRLTDQERIKLQEVTAAFYQMAQSGNEAAQEVTFKKLIAAIGRTEREVVHGAAPAHEVMARLDDIYQRIQTINTYTDSHQPPGRRQSSQSPSL